MGYGDWLTAPGRVTGGLGFYRKCENYKPKRPRSADTSSPSEIPVIPTGPISKVGLNTVQSRTNCVVSYLDATRRGERSHWPHCLSAT